MRTLGKDITKYNLSRVGAGESTSAAEDKELANMKKRKLCIQVTRKYLKISKGSNFRPVRVKKMADITKEMLENQVFVLCN